MHSRGLFYTPTILKMMPSVYYAFMSWRFITVIIAILGVSFCSIFHGKCDREYFKKAIFCLFVMVVPFVACFIRGDRPFDRSFVNIIPLEPLAKLPV